MLDSGLRKSENNLLLSEAPQPQRADTAARAQRDRSAWAAPDTGSHLRCGSRARTRPAFPRDSEGSGTGFPSLRWGCRCTCVCPDCPRSGPRASALPAGATATQPRRQRPRAQVPRASSAAARPVSWTAPSEFAPALPWVPRTPSSRRQGVLATKRENVGRGVHGLRESLPGPPRHGRLHPKAQSLHLTVSKGRGRAPGLLFLCWGASAPSTASSLRHVYAFVSSPGLARSAHSGCSAGSVRGLRGERSRRTHRCNPQPELSACRTRAVGSSPATLPPHRLSAEGHAEEFHHVTVFGAFQAVRQLLQLGVQCVLS